MARPQSFFDASTKGDLVSRLTVDVTVLQTTLAGAHWAGAQSAELDNTTWPGCVTVDRA